MNPNKTTIASFNPNIQTYILIIGACLLLITVIGIPLLLIWLLGAGQYISRRYYENLHCSLTAKQLQFKKGVWFQVEKTIPLENIQDLTFIDNPLLRYLDLRILKIETAGQSSTEGANMKLVGIRGAEEFKNEVLKQRELLTSKEPPPSSGEGQEFPRQILEDIRALLEDIKANQEGGKAV